jgi:hypothetical protein
VKSGRLREKDDNSVKVVYLVVAKVFRCVRSVLDVQVKSGLIILIAFDGHR